MSGNAPRSRPVHLKSGNPLPGLRYGWSAINQQSDIPGKNLVRSQQMRKALYPLLGLMAAAVASFAGPASPAAAADASALMATDTAQSPLVQSVTYDHERWRSHHRWGSGGYHERW